MSFLRWAAIMLTGFLVIGFLGSMLIGLSEELEQLGAPGVVVGIVLGFVLGRYVVDR